MQKSTLAALLLFIFCAPAAGAAPASFGERGCRFMLEERGAVAKASWQGPCKDGYADGTGVLTWQGEDGAASRYEGTMLRGQRDGPAYVAYANGDQFEGLFGAGKRNGKGTLLERSGTEYTGDWKDGAEHGQGSRTYAMGGRYDGQWKDGKFHGHGKALYIGGDLFEGEFVDGNAGVAAPSGPAPDEREYKRLEDGPNGLTQSYGKRNVLYTGKGIPFSASYAQLTPAQKQAARSAYVMLKADDEPPFPVEGMKSVSDWMARLQHKVLVEGELVLYVSIGADGKAASVKVLKSPNPEVTRAAGMIMMNEQFKPGVCAGAPCAMPFAISYLFILE